MAFPTFVQAKGLAETTQGTTHTFPAFTAIQAGDILYAVLGIAKLDMVPTFSGWGGASEGSSWGTSGANAGITWARVLCVADGSETALSLTTPGSTLVAGVAAQYRGASAPVLGDPDHDEAMPYYTNNPGLAKFPFAGQVGQNHRQPTRTSDLGTTQTDAKAVTSFVRAGATNFSTVQVDPIGGGAAHGAPYLCTRNIDLGAGDGTNTHAFTVRRHAESDDGTLKVQAGIADYDALAAQWNGHPSWDAYVYKGQVYVSAWYINGGGAAQFSAPTATFGLRLKV